MYNVLVGFGGLFALSAITAVLLGLNCIGKTRLGAKYMREMCFASAAMNVFYFISILPVPLLLVSVMTTLYNISIDVMLMCLLAYTLFFTKHYLEKRIEIVVIGAIHVWMIFDFVVHIVNIFNGVAIHFEFRDTPFARYAYGRGALFYCHPLLSYAIIAVVFTLLIQRILTVPTEYRSQYVCVLMSILAVLIINTFYQIWPGEGEIRLLDWSMLSYNMATFIYFWISFHYATHGMLDRHKSLIFENIGQGIVLFDYAGDMILTNSKVKALLRGVEFNEALTCEMLIEQLGLGIDRENGDETCSQQCEVDGQFLRCDYSVIRNKKNRKLGYLFVFTNASQETDLNTGFQKLENFRQMVEDKDNHMPVPTAAVVFDINNLSFINMRYGRTEGDRRIHDLSEQMRKAFPKSTYFVRGNEAQMIALCFHEEVQDVKRHIIGFKDDVEYAVAATTAENPDICQAIETALSTLSNIKLMDSSSMHHELVNSLMNTLEQCDPDTTEHVKRTQKLGEQLGKRIHLTEFELSQLSLLCMLHDIGKIAIPLEILNKPGSLNKEEWKVMQSHVQKGYEMARNSKELASIADMILHHHERWDGKGYPDGLDRESIPMLSRIIAVVDSYDAMTNDRVYRKALSKQAAQKELLRGAGTQFDPVLVTEFIGIFYDEKGDFKLEDEKEETEPQQAEKTASGKGEAENWVLPKEENVSDSVHDVWCSEISMDDELHVLSADNAFEKITGYKPEEVASFLELLPINDRTTWLMHYNSSLAGSSVFILEHSLKKKSGEIIYVSATVRPHFNAAQKANRIEMILVDTEKTYSRKKMQKQEEAKAMVRMRRWAEHYRKDSLTGLLAHEPFVADVEEYMLRGEKRVMMIMMDVDHFKTFNDTYGHQKGDQLLQVTAEALRNAIRSTDLAGRMGGDEFAAALFFTPNVSEESIGHVIEKLFNKVSAQVDAFSAGQKVSMGAALSGNGVDTFEKLYIQADHQLYASKDAGRGRLSVALKPCENTT